MSAETHSVPVIGPQPRVRDFSPDLRAARSTARRSAAVRKTLILIGLACCSIRLSLARACAIAQHCIMIGAMTRRTTLPRSSQAPLRRKRPNARRAKPRRGPMRDPGYLAWLRERHCIACITPEPRGPISDPAHGPANGRGSKGPDNEAVPLCRHHHIEQHRVGWAAFEAKYGFSRDKEAATHYAAFVFVNQRQYRGSAHVD